MKKIIITGILVLLVIVFLYWQDNVISTTKLTIKNTKVPDAFKGYKILQISDLHNKDFGEQLAKKSQELAPDIIVLTGDLVDSRRTNIQTALNQVEKLVDLAPIYYVNGNHEARIDSYQDLVAGLKELKVTVLENEKLTLVKDTATIDLIGLNDRKFFPSENSGEQKEQMVETLQQLVSSEGFQILLAHRPELIEDYAKSRVDLVFSGHAHGGQARLPFIGGLYAPEQGFLPEYTAGKYTSDATSMVVSRGLGNSLFPFRVFNRPELVLITLDN